MLKFTLFHSYFSLVKEKQMLFVTLTEISEKAKVRDDEKKAKVRDSLSEGEGEISEKAKVRDSLS